ncbi:hypothetical protein BJX64DRAFT_76013 [Aspergillus heterothallicus]
MQFRNLFRSFLARFLPSCPSGIQRQFGTITGSARQRRGPGFKDEDLFKYTSGRWIYNEQLRLTERYLEFDVPALQETVAAASGRATSDITSFSKMSEGGFNRLFQVTFNDGREVIARIPYPSTRPEHYCVASEVATLDYLRGHGIPTPEVYAWCSTRANPVGVEYIIMEKLGGTPLGDVWYTMTPKEQHKIMKQIVEWEARLMSLKFPASGSIYYRRDVLAGEGISFPNDGDGEFCIGPIAHYSWWHEERAGLNLDRGPWTSSNQVFRAVGERELKWAKTYAKPRLPYERLYREIHNFSNVSPESHIENLSMYLTLAQCLGFKPGSSLDRPVLRHPDLQPNNLLVSETKQVLGIVDWQHCTTLPLGLAAGIPSHFQNYGDPDSEKLLEPEIDLPADYASLGVAEQTAVRETMRKRLVHFLYAALTKSMNQKHYNAIFNQCAILHQRLFMSAGTPWEGDSASLPAEMIRAIQSWPILITEEEDSLGHGDEQMMCSVAPISYPDAMVHDTLHVDAQQREADAAMEQMRGVLGVDILGWVPNDDEYQAAKEMAREIKARMIEAADTPADVAGIQDHFPFDDFDESS